MLAEVMLQFMRLQPAFAHESLITILTFSQNLPKKGSPSHYQGDINIPPSPCRGWHSEDVLHYLGNILGEGKCGCEVGTRYEAVFVTRGHVPGQVFVLPRTQNTRVSKLGSLWAE